MHKVLEEFNEPSPRHYSKKHLIVVNDPGTLSSIARALSSRTRIKILKHIARRREVSLGDLARELGLSISTVSKHVKILEKTGLVITGVRAGKHGLTKVLRCRGSRILIMI